MSQTLEIGLALGASAATISAALREMGQLPARQHVAIDPFQSTVWDDVGRLTLEDEGLHEFVAVFEKFSDAVLPALVSQGWECDLAYIDGSHLFEDVFVDFHYVGQLLRPNGVVLFDDCTDPHVNKVIQFIRRNRAGAFSELDLSPYRTSASLKYTVAKRLGRVQLVGFVKTGESRRPWNDPFRRF